MKLKLELPFRFHAYRYWLNQSAEANASWHLNCKWQPVSSGSSSQGKKAANRFDQVNVNRLRSNAWTRILPYDRMRWPIFATFSCTKRRMSRFNSMKIWMRDRRPASPIVIYVWLCERCVIVIRHQTNCMLVCIIMMRDTTYVCSNDCVRRNMWIGLSNARSQLTDASADRRCGVVWFPLVCVHAAVHRSSSWLFSCCQIVHICEQYYYYY